MGTYKKKQYLGVQNCHVYKHSDTNLRFYLILQQLKSLTSGNIQIQLLYPTVVHAFKFTAIVTARVCGR